MVEEMKHLLFSWRHVHLPLLLAGGLLCWPLLTPCAVNGDNSQSPAGTRWTRSYSGRFSDPELQAWARRPAHIPPIVVDGHAGGFRLLTDAELGIGAMQMERAEYSGREVARDMAAALIGVTSIILLDPEIMGFEKGKEERFVPVCERPWVEVNANTMTLRREAIGNRKVAMARCVGRARAVVTSAGGTLHVSASRIDYRADRSELIFSGFPTLLAGSRSISLPGEKSFLRLDLRQMKLIASAVPSRGEKVY